MAELRRSVSPAAAWFLYSESGEPMGRVYRQTDPEAEPTPRERFKAEHRRGTLEVVSFEELSSACILRRFRVVVREAG